MPLTLHTRSPDSEEESYIESPTLTQAGESEDDFENDEDIVPEDVNGASDISQRAENGGVEVSAELGGSAVEEEMLKVYRTALDGDRAMPERKHAFKKLLREVDGKAYNKRELAATFLLSIDVMESDILDEKEEILALLRLLQHQDENVRTLAFNQLPSLIPRCPLPAVDYPVSVVVQNLRKSLTTCTWSSPSEALAIQSAALYLAGHHAAAFFNEVFQDATRTHHHPLKWLSENYSTLKTTTFIEHPESGEELIRVMEQFGSGVAEGMNKCIRALECSMGIMEIWKGLVRVPGEVGIALLGTWLGGSPRPFLGYGRTGSLETVAVKPSRVSSPPPTKEETPPAKNMEASPSNPSSTPSSKSERSQESHVKSTPTRDDEIPSYKHRPPPAPIHTKRKSITGDKDTSWCRHRRQSAYIGPVTAPLSAPFSRGVKRRRYDSFRPGSPRNSSSRRLLNNNPRNGGPGHSYNPIVHGAGVAIVCNPASVPGDHQHNSNRCRHRNSHQQYQHSSRPYSSPCPTPTPPKPAFGSLNNMQIPHTPPLTATWQKPFQGQSPKFPQRGYRTYLGEGRGGRNDRGSRGRDMWNTGRHGGGIKYMGYQHCGRWFSSYGSSDRYLGEAGRGEGSNQPLDDAGTDTASMPPKSPRTLQVSINSEVGGDTAVGSGIAGNDSETYPSIPILSLPPLNLPSV